MIKEVTGKVKLLVVKVPKDSFDFHIIHDGTRVAYFIPLYKRFDIPKGNYTILGKLNDLKDHVCKELVETIHVEIAPSPSNDMCGSYDYAYVDYEQRGEFAGWGGDAGCCVNPKDSLITLLDANECFDENDKNDVTFLILQINEPNEKG